MSFATRNAAGEADVVTAFSCPTRRKTAHSAARRDRRPFSTKYREALYLPPSSDLSFETFAALLHRDLAANTALGRVLADRAVLAAWRLHLASRDEFEAAREGGHLAPVSPQTLQAERSLETVLEILETARAARWGRAPLTASKVSPPAPAPEADIERDDDTLSDADLSNEWTTLPDDLPLDDETDDLETDAPARWEDRLIFDFNVSKTSPVVKGTWVTVSQVVSLIVDGWTWSEILRTHPELTEDDIRTCLSYTVEQDDRGEY